MKNINGNKVKKEQLEKILQDISSVKIAVLGDFCLDAYWFIDESKSEISIETGQKTRPELADLLQTARYLQLLGEGDVSLPVHDHVAGLVRTALYEQRLLNPRTTRLDIAKVMTRLQRIFQL